MKNTENDAQAFNEQVLGEITSVLDDSLYTSLSKNGPTIYGKKSELTFHVYSQRSGKHTLHISRTKKVSEQLINFLVKRGFQNRSFTPPSKYKVIIYFVPNIDIADMINRVEADFKNYLKTNEK